MLIAVRATAAYNIDTETFLSLMIEPPLIRPTHRVLDERLVTSPSPFCELRNDLYGNVQRHLIAAAGRFSFEFNAQVDVVPNTPVPFDAVEHSPQEIPAEAMVFTLPSRYCQSDLLCRMARSEFGTLPPGGERVVAIADWIRRHVEYRYGTTDSLTSAYDTATERVGVCRDFAHLLIALCRALGIPARYVSGYALGLDPPDFHGYAQVYMGGSWHNVDATTATPRPALIPIAVGRDAADVAIATLWSNSMMQMQTVEVREISGYSNPTTASAFDPNSVSPNRRGHGV